MFSGEGEVVKFCETLYPTGNVEDWLLEVERVMKSSLKEIIREALLDYKEVPWNSLIRALSIKRTVVAGPNSTFVTSEVRTPH